MKQITINIPEKKINFFMELVKQLGIEVVDEEGAIPTWQKKQLDKALDEHKNGSINYTDWKEAKDIFLALSNGSTRLLFFVVTASLFNL